MQPLQIELSFNYFLKQAGIALVYAQLAFLNLHYYSFLKFVTVPDLASGLAVAVLILWGPQNVLGILTGAVLATVLSGASNVLVLVYAAGAGIQALLGYYFVDFYRKKNNSGQFLSSLRDYFFFIFAVGFVSAFIRPLCISLALLFSGNLSQEFFVLRFSTMWLGDALGVVLLVPLIVKVTQEAWPLPTLRKSLQVLILCSASALAGQVIFFDWFQAELGNIARPYWMFLFIAWIAIALGVRVTSFILLLISIQAFGGAINGTGDFSEDIVLTGLMNYSFFIFILCFLGMALALYANEQIRNKNTLLTKLNELVLKGQALDAISQGVLISDNQRHIAYVNRAFQEMTGYKIEEILGKPCLILLGEDSSADTVKEIQNSLDAKRAFFGELLSYRKDGSNFWSEVSLSPVINVNGENSSFVAVHHDITNRKSGEAQALLAKAVFEHNLNGIIVTDAEQHIVMVNPTFVRMSGYDEVDVLGKKPGIFHSGQHDPAFYSEMWRKINTEKRWEGEIWNSRKNGEIYPEWLSINSVSNDRGEITHYIGMHSDLSQNKKAEENIQRLANFDVLTGLPNLIFMQNQGDLALSFARLNQSSFAVLFLDLDHFQYVNDSIGHQCGDLLLVEFAKRIQLLLREADVLSRQGGDEFIVLLPGASEKAATHVAKKILDACLAPFQIETHILNISTSIGIAVYPHDGNDFSDLSKSADTALFHAKQQGRNNYQCYESQMSNEVNERVRLESALHLAVTNDQFELHYQALTDMQSGKITGFEALIRWEHPELGQVSPVRFIPVAEECGAINAIGAWVLNKACLDIRSWLDQGLAAPQVAINFSPRQFRDPHLILHIQDALARYQLPATALCIEITEGVLMDDAQVSQLTLSALKELGITLSLDDFGTGYSSLNYLKLFPFDKVKIDQSFVRDLTSNNQDAAIVVAIIGMAHSLGIKVLAEGVETEAQCEFLRNNMADEIQGFFFSKPIPSDAAADLIRENRCLPAHLLRLNKAEKTLLLVDDEQNIVSSLKRLLRKDGYHILTANSGQEGLDILTGSKVDVIISDQRMPGMTGVEFLRNVKELYPETIRMVLSGYTELNSVTDAINEGAVFRFLTKPWDDEKLREHIKDAFQYKALADDNRLLSLKAQTSNQELAAVNRQLAALLQQKQQQIARDALSLDIVREALQYTPVAVIGLDDTNAIVFANDAASDLFSYLGPIFGEELGQILPEIEAAISKAPEASDILLKINDKYFDIRWRRMGEFSQSSGKIIIFSKIHV